MSLLRVDLPATSRVPYQILLGVMGVGMVAGLCVLKFVMFPEVRSLGDFGREPMALLMPLVAVGDLLVWLYMRRMFGRNVLPARVLEVVGSMVYVRDVDGVRREEKVIAVSSVKEVKMSVVGNMNGEARLDLVLVGEGEKVKLLSFSREKEVLDLAVRLREVLGLRG